MGYNQITSEERYTLGVMRAQGEGVAKIAKTLRRHRSTIYRELERNASQYDGAYRPSKAQKYCNGRRRRSKRNQRHGPEQFKLVEHLLRKEQWSPAQIAGTLALEGWLKISHETIYRHIWADQKRGGTLFRHLRYSPKRRRKRYGRKDSRGRLEGKRHISTRPAAVEKRQELGHWEMDTVMGAHASHHCVITLVERVTGYVLIGKLKDRTAETTTACAIRLIRSHLGLFQTITADNGTEFHDYEKIEEATGVTIYFATPYHSWERGTNENTNGLLRQYLPKRTSMATVTQEHCTAIATKLNNRPRLRHGFKSPLEELVWRLRSVAVQM
jgi:IS30 family transposase